MAFIAVYVLAGDINSQEKISNGFSSSSSSHTTLTGESDEYIQSWREPIDLSSFETYFPELCGEQVF